MGVDHPAVGELPHDSSNRFLQRGELCELKETPPPIFAAHSAWLTRETSSQMAVKSDMAGRHREYEVRARSAPMTKTRRNRNIECKRNRTNLQILARMSPLPVAKRVPVGLGATEITIRANRISKGFPKIINRKVRPVLEVFIYSHTSPLYDRWSTAYLSSCGPEA